MALAWIESPGSHIAEAGWSTLSSLVALKEDSELDLPVLEQLVARVRETIHQSPDAARHGMDGFIITVGCCVASLTGLALRVGEAVGPVTAGLGSNQCQVPFAPDYIRKVQKRGAIGKKRKTVKC